MEIGEIAQVMCDIFHMKEAVLSTQTASDALFNILSTQNSENKAGLYKWKSVVAGAVTIGMVVSCLWPVGILANIGALCTENGIAALAIGGTSTVTAGVSGKGWWNLSSNREQYREIWHEGMSPEHTSYFGF